MPAPELLTELRNTMNAAKRANTHNRSIYARDCDQICFAALDCVGTVEKYERSTGDLITSLKCFLYLLTFLCKLSMVADTSSGWLVDAVYTITEKIENLAAESLLQEKTIKTQTLNLLLRESKKEVYEEWSDMRHKLLDLAVPLIDKRSLAKIEKLLDEFAAEAEQRAFPEFDLRELQAIRYKVHRQVYGRENTREELEQNLDNDSMRLIAVQEAALDGDYDAAERLCLPKIRDDYYDDNPEDWNNVLFEVYKQSGDTEKELTQAKKILLFSSARYWDIVKGICQEQNTWDDVRGPLLKQVQEQCRQYCYREILVSEKEWPLLLEDLSRDPEDIFDYEKYLRKDYPDQFFAICQQKIMARAERSVKRSNYRTIVRLLKKMVKWGGRQQAIETFWQLHQLYSDRPAMMEELASFKAFVTRN